MLRYRESFMVEAKTRRGEIHRRVWCETLSHLELLRFAPLLEGRDIEVIVAVQPSTLSTLREVMQGLRDRGIPASVWPMLENDAGRWLSNGTAEAFVPFLTQVEHQLGPASEHAYVIDIEPHFAVLQALAQRRVPPLPRYGKPSAELAAWAQAARGRGATLRTANMPTQVFAPLRRTMNALFGLPLVEAPHHNVMLYSSMIAGIGRVSRRTTERIMHAVLNAGKQHFGSALGVSLGTVGPGAFGDEPCYRSADELRRDMMIAKAHQVAEIALFDLGGIVRSKMPEAWLEALCE